MASSSHMLPTVTLKPLYHRGSENMAICFANNASLSDIVKKLKGIKWTRTHKCWYLPLSKQSYAALKSALSDAATIHTEALKSYLEQRKSVRSNAGTGKLTMKKSVQLIEQPLCADNIVAYNDFVTMIQLKGYSASTLRTYSDAFYQLLRLLKTIPVQTLTKQHIHSYLFWLLKRGCSENHVHTVVNALKFYFEQVEKRPKEFYNLPRPKKPQKLPSILGEKEVERLIKAVWNLKHQALLMTAYSAGLRVSELVNLKVMDIDSSRMILHIRQGKGKKDRMVTLSETLLTTLRKYYAVYKPKEYLFEGEKGAPYSTRSAQLVLHGAKKEAGIYKQGSIHSLRHAYATHLLESGIDVRYIQDLLGHKSLTTTMLYTHVAKRDSKVIKSPLDRLNL